MVKYIVLIILSFSCYTTICQKIVGINFRIGESMLKDQNSTGTLKKINSYGFGLGIKFPINSRNQLNVQFNFDSKGAYLHVKDIYFKLKYYSIPVYYSFQFYNKKVSISPGVYFGFSIQSYGFLANTRPRYFYHFKRVDYGLTYLLELNIFNSNKFRIDLLHSLTYGIPSAYNIENSPRITLGPTNWIRNFTYDFGVSIGFKL